MRFPDTLLSVFPPPSFVVMPSAGIDISGGSIKWTLFSGYGPHTRLRSFGETPLPEGVIVGGDIEQPEKVTEVVRTLAKRHGIRYANVCLPEKKAFIYRTLVPQGARDLKSGVEFDFEAHVPIPPSDAIFDFEPVRTTELGTIVSVTAYAKRLVTAYSAVLEGAGIVPRSFEVESQALARTALNPADRAKVVMMIDFGKRTTRITIAEYGVVAFTATLDVGGNELTSAVMKHFSVPEAEAEQIKNERGFLMNTENKGLVEALMITVSVVRDEVAKHLSFWNSSQDNELPRNPVEKIIVCGGNANLKGFPEYLEGSLNVPVTVANVWTNAFSLDEYVPSMQFAESLEYATAIGLALRGRIEHLW